MKTIIRNIFIVIGILSTLSTLEAGKQGDRAEGVSMFALLANPERYEGKLIKVRGYFFHFSQSQKFLFNSREDYRGGVMKNSLWVYSIGDDFQVPERYVESMEKRLPLSNAHRKYVTIVGRFRRHMSYEGSSMPSGVIEYIFTENVSQPIDGQAKPANDTNPESRQQ